MSFEELPSEEILSREDEKTRRLLGSLKRVDAPNDFDFRLKARIAKGKSSDFAAPRLFPILRYVAPLSIAIVILAVLVFNGLYSFDDNSAAPPVLVENAPLKPVENKIQPVNNPLPEQNVVVKSADQKTNAESFDKKENPNFTNGSELAVNSKRPKIERSVVENNGGGSVNRAATQPPVFNDPKNSNVNKQKETPKDSINPNPPLSVKSVLSSFGIEAAYSENKWKVVSVKRNSLAERSGVEANDVIEAIDENQITTETISNKTVSGKNLRVTRDGKKLGIKLQNK